MIREACISDIKLLLEIENELFLPEDGKLSYRTFKYHICRGKRVFVIAEKEEIKGYILLRSSMKSMRIYSIGICSKAQGRGLGEILCEYGIDIGRKMLKEYISLEVRSKNSKAIALYQKLGFKVKKTLPSYYGNEDGLKMRKQL